MEHLIPRHEEGDFGQASCRILVLLEDALQYLKVFT
jgi:hypothetical protein